MRETDHDENVWTEGPTEQALPGERANRASDQAQAPISDVMGESGEATPDVMGAAAPQVDETLGDRHEGDEPRP